MKKQVNIFWFRRDLRLHDNAALYHALKDGLPVVPIFIFDTNILNQLENKTDRRVEFIRSTLSGIQTELLEMGCSLVVENSTPALAFKKFLEQYKVMKVFANHDYDAYAKERDKTIEELLQQHEVGFQTYKDHVIFEKDEVLKDDGKPYMVFTPYSKKWKEKLNEFHSSSYPVEKYSENFFRQPPVQVPSLKEIGFIATGKQFPNNDFTRKKIDNYEETRNYPSLEDGTSHMGIHLRFGTVSIRKLVRYAIEKNETFLNELIWREFYQMILWHYPKVGLGHSFKAEYDNIQWRNNEDEFEKWCSGNTGYPIVDAGMRELNETGYMHNRVRMIVASFLTKHLLIDWRWGEVYFAEKLLDYELASNNGGWQWAAGSGCDAAPYFRIFNPYLQTEKFDKEHKYIKKWVPEYQEFSYPKPIVDHAFARKRALEVYGNALKK